MIRARDYDAIGFDVYGTILDWEPEVADFLETWAAQNNLSVTRQKLMEVYDCLRQPLQEERPALRYPEVLKQTFDALAKEFGMPAPVGQRDDFGEIAAKHKPFPDSAAALGALKSMGFTLAALTNVDDRSFERATKSANISFDVIVTAQRVGAYKPDHTHFLAALSDLLALEIPQSRVLHVAQSRRADIVPANALGLTCVWINRPGHIFGRTGSGAETAKPDYETDSLAGFVALLEED